FKTLSQRLEKIDVDVFRSLDPLKSLHSEGLHFSGTVLWNGGYIELNTAVDFISFYEEMTPLVQTLPQIILHKELILSNLLSRLHMEGRLSLEPILRYMLIAALSRDLLKEFTPFLQKVADSLVSLLKSGADREPEIIEQIFTTWSYIMMYLKKYLVQDVVHVLRVTTKLRYYPKDYVQELMAEAVSFLLRNAKTSSEQLKKGTRKVMFEVAKKPQESRKSGVSALLWYVMRGASSKLHSRAGEVLCLLWTTQYLLLAINLSEVSLFSVNSLCALFYKICDRSFSQMDKESLLMIGSNMHLNRLASPHRPMPPVGSQSVIEVVTTSFQRLCEELESTELKKMWDCLFKEIGKIADGESSGGSLHLSRLLSILVSTIHKDYIQKISDYEPILVLVGKVMQKFILPSRITKAEDYSSEVVDNLLQLMLCILDGLHLSDNMSVLSSVSVNGLLYFNPQIVHAFRGTITRALNDLIETSEEEVILLLLVFCERTQYQVQSSSHLDGTPIEEDSRICSYLQNAIGPIGYWIGVINQIVHGDSSLMQLQETKFSLLWGIISCYPYMKDIQANSSLLLDFVDALNQLLVKESGKGLLISCFSENIAGFPKHTWQSLIGAALSSFNKLCSGDFIRDVVRKFLQLAARYRSSPQILCAVADFLDSMHRSTFDEISNVVLHPELKAEKATEALCVFAENLCHSDKMIRLSTLRILCHYQLINYEQSPRDEPAEIEMKTEVSQSAVDQGSKKVILLISRIHMGLSGERIAEAYVPSVLYGIIGIFHNRFSYLWDSASECIAVLISKYFDMTWDRFVQYLEQCESNFLAFNDQSDPGKTASTGNCSDLVERFYLFVSPASDNTPCTTVLSMLIQSLQKVPTVIESRSRQIIPLFLKFMGYDVNDFVGSFNALAFKGKEWKNVLKEWLTLLKLMRNPKPFYRSDFLKEVLQYRLLDENDAEIQMKVLDCLLSWKDDFLVPISQGLDGMSKWFWSSSEWSKDEFSSSVLEFFTMENIMALSWKKRYAFLLVIEDILDVFDELHVEPYLNLLMGCVVRILWSCTSITESVKSSGLSVVETHSSVKVTTHEKGGRAENQIMVMFKSIRCLFRNICLMLVLREALSSSFERSFVVVATAKVLNDLESELESTEVLGFIMTGNKSWNFLTNFNCMQSTAAMKQFKELRSLCLKIISLVLNKYADHELGCKFWDFFFDSVRPLIDGFKQEGASSEKPSSLFSCFLCMTGSYKLISLLYRKENLVPNILSILTVPTASEDILSCVLNFVENLLNLDSELDPEDDAIKRILLPSLDALICGLHCLCKFNNGHGGMKPYLPSPLRMGWFRISHSGKQKPLEFKILVIIRQTVLESESKIKVLDAVSPLLISVNLDVRMSVCDLLDALAGTESSLIAVINKDFFYTVREKHALIILSHAVHDMSSEEMILRQSGFGLLLSFVEFSAEILDRDMRSDDQSWPESSIARIINKFIFKHMGDAMNKEAPIQKVWIDLLREMVLKLPMVPSLKSFQVLCSEDAEQDFFNNLMHLQVLETQETLLVILCYVQVALWHCGTQGNLYAALTDAFVCSQLLLQKHRRSRALSRFRNFVSSGNLSEVITTKVFVPLFFNMLFELQNGKAENIRSACLEALASISGNMEWESYYAFLMRCFREMTRKSVMQKVLLRLICFVLDHFHFMDNAKDSVEGSKAGTTGMTSKIVLRRCYSSAEVTEIQACLQKTVLPKIQKLLMSDSDNVNVRISVVALKLLKLLPGDVMEFQLPSIVHRISNFLKHRLESIRDEARVALVACLKELGLEYLHFIIKVLRSNLKRGYELHVLGYTLNFMLSKFLVNPISGKLDYCLEELLSVVEHDILGDVSEEKEVEQISSKMKETRKFKSFETLQLIAQNITFKTHAVKLLEPVTSHLQKHLTPKVKSKLECMLTNIAAGIECNPSINQADLFIFLYGHIKDGISYETHTNKRSSVANTNKQPGDKAMCKIIASAKLIDSCSQSSHLITVFALGLLHNCLKSRKRHKKDEELLSKLIPSLESQADKIKTSLLAIAQGSINSSPLMQSCLRLLTVLLRNPRITLSADQLHMVIQFPLFIDLERNPSSIALSLLKAIVQRKLVVHEIYDLVSQAAKLMVTSQVESIRKICSQIVLHYEHSSGRETVLEMLHVIVIKFPKAVNEHSLVIFVRLVFCLANDNDNKVRSMTGAAIKLLIGHVRRDSLDSILEFSFSWYMEQDLRSAAAAQGLDVGANIWESLSGFELEEIGRYMKTYQFRGNGEGEDEREWEGHSGQFSVLSFYSILHGGEGTYKWLLPVMRSIFRSAVDVLKIGPLDLSVETTWKGAYYSLIMLEKILHQFRDRCLASDLEQNAEENSDRQQSLLVTLLLKRMGKIALQMDAVQMKIVFNVFKSISPKILDRKSFHQKLATSRVTNINCCYLCTKFVKDVPGKLSQVSSDDVKQLAQEALETIRDTLGMNKFALFTARSGKISRQRGIRGNREKR
ncbi:hypothetical protein C3L33_14914, partial [Rhododendron williamsianum]